MRNEPGVRVVYGSHVRPVDPVAVVPAGRPVRGVVLETGDADWAADPERTLAHYRTTDRQYAALFPVLERRGVPVYFLEAATRFPVRDVAVMAAESAVGVGVCVAAARFAETRRAAALARARLLELPPPSPTRRGWLAGAAAVAAGAWLQLPLASAVARGVGHGTAVDGLTTDLRRVAVATHPECERTHLFRNGVLALKLRAVGPGLVAVLGPTHTPIEDDLGAPGRDLLARVRAFRASVPVTAPETVSGVCRLDFAGGRWRVAERGHVADLRPLAG